MFKRGRPVFERRSNLRDPTRRPSLSVPSMVSDTAARRRTRVRCPVSAEQRGPPPAHCTHSRGLFAVCRTPTPGTRVPPNTRAPIRVFSQLSVISRGRIIKRGNRWGGIICTNKKISVVAFERLVVLSRCTHPPPTPPTPHPSLDSLTARNAGIHRGIRQLTPVETFSI